MRAAGVKEYGVSQRTLWLAVLVPAIVGLLTLLSGLALVSGLPDTYTARALVVFTPRPSQNGVVPGSEIVVLAANNAVGLVTASGTVQAVSDQTGIPAEELLAATEATVIPGTATLAIEVTLGSSEPAAAAANAYASALTKDAKDSPVAIASQLSVSTAPVEASGPSRRLLSVVVVLIAVVAVLITFTLVIVVLRMMDQGGVRGLVTRWVKAGESVDRV